jgi:Zn-dependent protease/CBS domain-containing protein
LAVLSPRSIGGVTGGTPDGGRQGERKPRWFGPATGQDTRYGIVVARPFGIPVYLSPAWFLVAGLFIVFYANNLYRSVHPGGLRYAVAAAFVVLLYVSVLLHELSHSVVARAFRLPVKRILLYPLGGFSEIEQEPPTPGQEFLVSAAGPVLSLVLAGAGYGLAAASGIGGIARVLVEQLVVANVLVGFFNLLPGLPLDGGRILRAGIWRLTGRPIKATIAAAWTGRAIAIAMVVVPFGIYGSLTNLNSYAIWMAIIAVFIWISAGQAIRVARLRERLPAVQARSLARRAIPIPPNLPLSEAIRRADAAQARALVVVDQDSTPVGIVSEAAVIATPEQRRPWVEVGTLARTLVPGLVLSADLSGMALIDAVRKAPASEYLLVEPSGQVYGVLAASDLDHAFAGA